MIIGTRNLKVRSQQGDVDVPVRIFAPVEDAERGWGCKFEIEWPNGADTMTARGIDAIQALEIAMKMIGAHLYTSKQHEAGELMFDKRGAGYGFPVPQNMRDLLIGDDAKFL